MNERNSSNENVAMIDWDDCSPEQQVERWRQVERVLVNLPTHERERHWDMSSFGYLTDCGTVACAAGHCGLDPWFRERGWRLDFVEHGCGYPACKVQRIGSVARFFGEEGSEEIFYNERRRGVDEVIAEVREYVSALLAALEVSKNV